MSDPRLKRDAQKYRGVADLDSDFAEMQTLWNTALEQAVAAHSQVDGEVDNENVGGDRYSVANNVKDENGNSYNNVVVVNTDIFNGVKPRNWAIKLKEFVKNNLVGKQVSAFDENGNTVIIEFAKYNERVKKDGSKNSHKVIDKLATKKDRNSQLTVANAVELVEISNKISESNEHVHQWLDENGWEYRKTYMMFPNGSIYEATLNIGKAKDGRNILYDINKIKEVGWASLPTAAPNGAVGLHSTPTSENRVTQKEPIVKQNIVEEKNSFGDEDEQYLQAVQNGDTETAQKLFDATTKRAGYDIIDFKPNKFKIKKRIHQEFGESRTPRNDVSSDINISQNNIVVNRNYAQNLKNNTNSVDEDKYSFGDEDEQYLQAVTNLAA